MKTLILLSVLCMAGLFLHAQTPFKVISVSGEIIAKKTNVTLQSGIEVKSDENFQFVKPSSRAALFNSKYGRILLSEQNSTDAFSKAGFAPAMGTVTTRGTSNQFLLSKSDLSKYFNDKLLVIDKLEIRISNQAFPMNDKAWFFIRYMYNGDEINKRLSFVNDTLVVDKKELYTVDGKPIPNPDITGMKLYYYENLGDNSKATLISSFDLIFIPAEQLKQEVGIILSEMEGKSYDETVMEVFTFLTDFYGAIDLSYIQSWLAEEMNYSPKK